MPIDKKIIKNYKEGYTEAFDSIYHYYSKKLFYFARGLVKDEDVAKDLLQEVFINLWEKRDQVDQNLNFDNYIFTITYNCIRKFFRKKSIENKVMDHLIKNSPELIESAEGTFIYKELLELATRTINRLPPKRKMIYKLNKQEGMKIKEIASKLNISPRTAEHQLASALKFLKEELSNISLFALLFYHLFLS